MNPWTIDPEGAALSYETIYGTPGFGIPNHSLAVELGDQDNNKWIDTKTGASTLPDDVWVLILVSAKTNLASGSKQLKVYFGDTDVTGSIDDAASAFSTTMNGLPYYVGTDLFNPLIGDIAEYWFAPNQSLLDVSGDIPLATRRKFISASGKPVDLGADGSTPTGVAPAIFQRRAPGAAASTFATNLGTGGNFTITGTLTNAPTSPSD